MIGGDARFFWPENIGYFVRLPSAWDSSLNTGIGIQSINTLWITSYLNLTSFLSNLGISWSIIDFVFWVIPALLLAFFSTFFLFRTLINKNTVYAFLSGLIFLTNTYFLTVFLGGQRGISLAYALTPLVFLSFIKLVRTNNFYSSILFGLVLSLELLFDPRFLLLSLGILSLYYLVRLKFSRKHLITLILIPFSVMLLLHSYWIIPLILFKSSFLPEGFSSIESLKFFSFAFFENSISLLHPNWPENIFGKTYFMRPEFLILPALAFSSLLFVKKDEKSKQTIILFFLLLALLGALFAKGTNDPFGTIFSWAFNNIPAFSFFRDPTKFYSMVSLSYAILIPYALFNISKKFKKRAILIAVIFVAFWLFTLRGLFIDGTDLFKSRTVSESYVNLKNFIFNQNGFFRTVWIPYWQRYGYFSDKNPAIGRGELFKEASASGMVRELSQPQALQRLQNLSVKYIIIPDDSEGEFFLEDRKYSENEYQKTVSEVEKLAWIGQKISFGKNVVFEVPSPKEHFWSPNNNLSIAYSYIKPTKYTVEITNAKKNDLLVFSESYDRYWVTKSSKFKVQSSKFRDGLNSFILPNDGDYSLEVYYEPQRWVEAGLAISGASLLAILIILARQHKNK